MKSVLRLAVAAMAIALAGCIWVSPDDVDPGFDFNGFWRLELTGCQSQVASAEIFQDGPNFTMYSGRYEFRGTCDPIAGTFQARTDAPWGFWSFSGAATNGDFVVGTYVYEEYLRRCAGQFSATRVGYRGAGPVAGPALERK